METATQHVMESAPNAPALEIRQRIAVALGAAILVAGVILVTFILPAEFAVDPLGTGARLGLLPLGEVGQQVAALNQQASEVGKAGGAGAIVATQDKPFQQESVDFKLAPHEGMGYKYRLDKGE